jgi:hypothetical protein
MLLTEDGETALVSPPSPKLPTLFLINEGGESDLTKIALTSPRRKTSTYPTLN